jgi:hypothetical protein
MLGQLAGADRHQGQARCRAGISRFEITRPAGQSMHSPGCTRSAGAVEQSGRNGKAVKVFGCGVVAAEFGCQISRMPSRPKVGQGLGRETPGHHQSNKEQRDEDSPSRSHLLAYRLIRATS